MILKCKVCGHDWNSKVLEPLCCPKCKRYDWNKTKGELNPSKEGDASHDKKKKEVKSK